MNPYAVPSLVCGLFMLALGLIALLYGRREPVNRVFAWFCLALSAAAFASFIFHQSRSLAQAERWTKVPYLFAIPAAILTVHYVLVLTGEIERLDRKLLGLRLRHLLIGLYGYGAVILVLTIASDSVIAGAAYYAPTGYEHTYGPWFLETAFGMTLLTVLVIGLLARAYRRAESAPRRVELKYNLLGFSTLYAAAGIMTIYLPYFGIQTHSLSLIPFTVAALIFYLAIVRSQFSQIDELNRGLEDKVERRTRELRAAQARLVHSEKMAALGQLVAGIAHEIHSPLGSLHSNSDLLGRAVRKLQDELARPGGAEPASVRRLLDTLAELAGTNRAAGERIARVVRSLKDFATLDRAEVLEIELRESIETVLALLAAELRDRIELIRDYGATPKVTCQASQLHQLLMNVLLNATQAIEGRGQIRVRTGREGERVWIEIHDSGRGIAAEQLGRIFDPGFTTKGVGVGTGLGLAICDQIIRAHSGEIMVQSEPGRGSTFTVRLPARYTPHRSGGSSVE
ncbi:MAG TPA: ATP-binding protein [Acidobacteriota bacterium]